jgi:CubicO group peptidase (beta-lactamase class C family)
MRRVHALWFPLTALLPAFEAAPAQSPAADLPLDPARIEEIVMQFRQENDLPAACIGIVSGDKLVYARGLGEIDLKRGQPAEADSLFQIGSVTKTFTATLLCILRDEGKLTLDDPVAKHLPPEVKAPTGEKGTVITLRHLATHTSGLPANPPNRRNVPDSPSVMMPYSTRELYEGLSQTRLQSEPGDRFIYSNYGFGLLGHALERAAGMPYETLLKERICKPLGMTSTSIALPDADLKRFAAHYWLNQPRSERPRWEFGEISGFGGIVSNVPDLAKYLSAQFHTESDAKSPIRGATLAELHKPTRPTGDRGGTSIALGWTVIESKELGPIVGHGGEVDGHSSAIGFLPRHKVGIIVLTNLGGNTGERLYRAIADYLTPLIAARK